MDMILPDVEFQDFDQILLITDQIDTLPGIFGKVTIKNPETVLRAKHDEVLIFIDSV